MEEQKLIELLSQFANFTNQEEALIIDNIYQQNYKANEIFLEKGKKETEMAFIIEGVFRFYFYDENGNEVITSFLKEGQFATILSEYTGIKKSSVYIQSVTDSKTIIITKAAWDLFCNKIPTWNNALQKIATQYFIEKTNHQRTIIKLNAEDSYNFFAETYPTIKSRVPLSYIANYLGITPYSLSRIRKRISKK